MLNIIIEHSGCVVPDMNFRTGRISKSYDDMNVLKCNIVARQCISAQKVLKFPLSHKRLKINQFENNSKFRVYISGKK